MVGIHILRRRRRGSAAREQRGGDKSQGFHADRIRGAEMALQ
jgi:hypothetical protein